jgi:tetratricopeptide (TPR) repeat protein
MKRWALLAILSVAAVYAVWTMVERDREGAWQTAYGHSYSLFASRHYGEAADALLAIMPEVERWWPNSPRQLQALVFLGGCYRNAHNYAAAVPLLKRALALSESLPAPDATQVGRLKFHLAVIARDELDDGEAERLFSESFELISKHPETAYGDDAGALLGLGAIFLKQGRYQEAEVDLTRAIAIYEANPSLVFKEDLANSFFQLAEVFRRQHLYSEAETQYLKSLNLCEKLKGTPAAISEQPTLSGLAVVELALGKSADAAHLLKRSTEFAENSGNESADTAGTALNNVALIAENEHDYAKAEAYYIKACDKYEQAGDTDNRNFAVVLENLADLYRDQDRFDMHKAEPLYERALVIRQKALGPQHPDTAQTLSDLSLLNFFEKKPSAAKEFAERALPIQEKALGHDGKDIATTLNRLGLAERDLHEFSSAERNLQRALVIREKYFEPNSTAIAIVLENLASVYFLEGQTEKAGPLIARAEAIRAHPGGE